MTETTTPTGDVDQNSSDITNESLLETTNNEETTAVEENNDTDQSASSESDSDNSSTTEESSNDNSEDITAFAKSQGLDPDNLSDNEKKLLTQLKKNSREERQRVEAEKNTKLDKTIEDVTPQGDATDAIAQVNILKAQIQAKNAKDTFWSQNPDDRKYESKMSEILLQEKETYGPDAAWQLAQNLPRLLREAKFAEGAFDSDAARDAGRREERENLRKAQEGGADSAHAVAPSATSNQKIDRDWIDNTYDPSNPEHVQMLDKAMASGELY